MPSQLVDDVRAALCRAGRPATYRERALLLAAVVRSDGTERDVVDELRAARAAFLPPHLLEADVPPLYTRLLRAVDAILEPVPIDPDLRPDRVRRPTRELVEDRTWRADVDG